MPTRDPGEGQECKGEGQECKGEGEEGKGEGQECKGEGQECKGEGQECKGEGQECKGEGQECKGEGRRAKVRWFKLCDALTECPTNVPLHLKRCWESIAVWIGTCTSNHINCSTAPPTSCHAQLYLNML